KDGIRAANSEQWIKLNNELKSRTETNIILFLPSPVFGASGFNDTLEADLLHDTLVETKDLGKNIFVVHGGNGTTTDLKDGIRYIQLNTKSLSTTDDIYDLHLIEFVVNGSDISYQINPVFQKPNIKVN
ncbi:MAG: phosphodiester glycosidase family protein, partial [Tissierellia bacterium]|nr:phosphodiester glycosidase family protein [Tissierellia bacterium]